MSTRMTDNETKTLAGLREWVEIASQRHESRMPVRTDEMELAFRCIDTQQSGITALADALEELKRVAPTTAEVEAVLDDVDAALRLVGRLP